MPRPEARPTRGAVGETCASAYEPYTYEDVLYLVVSRGEARWDDFLNQRRGGASGGASDQEREQHGCCAIDVLAMCSPIRICLLLLRCYR